MIGCKLIDFGNSCFADKQFTNDIQTRQYRCPETILHTPYSFSADIWSAACVIFEMLTGDYLFQPKEHGNVSRDLEQLALFEEVLGTIPSSFMATGKRCKEFMNLSVSDNNNNNNSISFNPLFIDGKTQVQKALQTTFYCISFDTCWSTQ